MVRYLNIQDAAEYLGYSRGYFAQLVREYHIPRKGPGGKRFDVRDLEAFMDDPGVFMNQLQPPPRRGAFTPVAF